MVEEDHHIDYERRYSDGRFAQAIRLVGKAWEATYLNKPTLIPPALGQAYLAWCAKQAKQNPDSSNTPGTLDVPLLGWLYDYMLPKKVLELQCGSGANLMALHHFGVEMVLGLGSRAPDQVLLKRGSYSQGNVAGLRGIKNKLDAILCMGSMAGLAEKDAMAVAKVAADSAIYHIVFSLGCGVTQERGNQLTVTDWLKVWRQHGWVPDVAATLAARAVSSVPSLRSSLLLLRPVDKARDDVPEDNTFLAWLDTLSNRSADLGSAVVSEAFGTSLVDYAKSFGPKKLS